MSERSLGPRSGATLASLILAAALTLPGCSEPQFELPKRWGSIFTSKGRNWVPASTLPRRPQKNPQVVIYEITRFPESAPTAEHRAAAKDLRRRCFDAAERNGWFDYETGLADGFRPMFGDEFHYVKEEFILDDVVLDPQRPEFLMYYDSSRGKQLVSFMFYSSTQVGWGPQVGGPLTVWHYHIWARAMCLVNKVMPVGVSNKKGKCKSGLPVHRSPEMLHVWLIDHPHGRFATTMALAPEVLEAALTKRGL